MSLGEFLGIAKQPTAADIMTTEIFSVSQHRDLNYVEVVAELRHVRHVPVVDKTGKPVGMLSVRDMLEHLSQGGASHFIPVKELMKCNLVTARKETSVREIAKLMSESGISAILIVENENLVGIVTERDFLKLFLEH